MTSPRPFIIGGIAAALVLAGCSAADSDADTANSADATDAALTVGAAFYPLQYVAERVGGDTVAVEPLIGSGVEPHDAEMSPKTVRDMQEMDTILFLSDFQPAVDDAIDTTGVRSLDAHHIIDEHGDAVAEHGEAVEAEDDHDHDGDGEADHAEEDHVDEAESEEDHDHDGDGEADHAAEDHDHAEDESADESTESEDSHDGHDHGTLDPHFWLDPTLLAEYAQDVADEFAELDPANADTYTANAESLLTDLDAIDASYTEGLATCERDDIFVGHEAFGYLALQYDLNQEGLAGIDPESEPSPARVREIRDMVEDSGATTIYTEDEVAADVAASIAEDVGVDVLVLSPIETVADGEDYLGVMETNLENLRTGLGCS
ncbi:metal ABC transporter substrate-binding protein [Demequina flava]|uniref:metal ABC transporter substrate-binding protein n=1 Tax=Demequina flava TaxID=1095025 RepID=UPI0007845ED9|nr:zinc ABC transporter substrate-binding protein [Demequina flava]